ncbi:MAG: glycosyltransferase family 4 protein [Aequorivita sp.]|nr:glycosyltransferase family 4 protein [Aequorivita sp.]
MSMDKALKLRYKNLKLHRKLLKAEKYIDFLDFDEKKRGVLIIDSIVPEYDRDSGSRRLFHIIEIMLKRNFNVFLMADSKEYKFKKKYCEAYRNLGAVVYEPALDKNNKLINRKRFIKIVSPHIEFAWLHRPEIFYKYYSFVKKSSNTKLVFDMVDFHYLRLKREWERSKEPLIEKEMDKYLQIELHNAEMADVVIPITEEDKNELFPLLHKKPKMIVVGNIHQFKKDNLNFKNFNQRENILFIGSFLHKPNIDAVKYLHASIFPILLKKIPALKIEIIGSYAPQEILDLNSENFRVLGFVEDISEYFNSAKIFVAPLAYGAGIKGKIGQSLEFGLPLVTTEKGAEGFDFSPTKELMVAPIDNPTIFVEKIIALYTNEKLWESVSENAEKILEPFSLDKIEARVIEILQ